MFNFAITPESEFIGSGALDGQGIPPDFFSDEHVRKGFSYCFDWDTFIADALNGEGVQTRGPIIDGLQGWSADNEIYTFDADLCRDELAQAWDGQLPTTGFQMTVAYNAGNTSRETVARLLAENLRAASDNYVIDVISLEWPAFLEARSAGTLPISVSGWQEDYHDASNWVHPFMHSAGAYARAQAFPAELQSEFDALIDQAVQETDETVRDGMYAELQQMALDNAISIFLYQATGRFYVNRDVSGWYNNPLAPATYYYALSKEG
jgi:peptide/nickel transport system substrate-binding protein